MLAVVVDKDGRLKTDRERAVTKPVNKGSSSSKRMDVPSIERYSNCYSLQEIPASFTNSLLLSSRQQAARPDVLE